MPTKYVEVDGYAVNYFHTGQTTLPSVTPDASKGKVLLYLHGAGSNGHFGHKMLDLLSAKHSPFSLDYPGHGRSSGTESLKSVTAYSELVYGFWKKLGLRPAVSDRSLNGWRGLNGSGAAPSGHGRGAYSYVHGGEIRHYRRTR